MAHEADQDPQTQPPPAAREAGSDALGQQGEPAGHQSEGDEHVVSDEPGIRSTGPVSGTGGTGVEHLGGMPGGTPNYGGVGSPGGSTGLGAGHGPGPDAQERGERGGDLGTGGQVVSGSGGPTSPQVLPGGATRPGSAQSGGTHADDPLARARQAGDSALNTGPSSTGGTLQRAPGMPGAISAPASPYPAMATSGSGDRSAGADSQTAGVQQHKQEDRHVEDARSHQPNADEVSGTGMGAAANDVDRRGAEAATSARSGGGATIGGSAPPNGAPPTPVAPDPYGGSIAESHADPGFPPPVPEQPTPGLTREPGPEAHT